MALPKQIRGKFLTDPEGKKFFRTTETGLEEVTKQSIGGGEVSGVGAEELASLRRGEVFAGGGLQTAFMPTFEQQHGTVAAVQQGKLDRAIRPDEIRMLRKAGISEAQLGGVKSDATFDQQFRARTGRFPTRAESIAGGQTVPQPTAPIGEGVAGLTNQEALARLKKEQENIAKYGTAIPTPDQIKAGPIVQPKIDTGVISKDTIGDTKKDKFETKKESKTVSGVFLTPEQEKQQKESDKAIEASNKIAEEGAFQAEQEEKFGVGAKTALVTDLESQFEAVNNEAKAITFELEKELERGGVTTAIAGRIERARLRENTLKALNISTRLAAAKGNLKTAQDFADRAVKAKFDPIKDRYNAAIRNLDILSKSPKATVEEKKQAADMKANQEAQKKIVKAQEALELFNKNLSIKVIAANPEIDQDTLDKIEAATSEIEAMKIASPYLQKARKGVTSTGVETSAGVLQPSTTELNKLLTHFPSDFKKHVKSVANTATFRLDKQSINQMFDQFKSEGIRQFISPTYLKDAFSKTSVDEMLKTLGKKRSDFKRFFKGAKGEESDIRKAFNDYLENTLMPMIEQHRAGGKTDAEILKEMQ